MRENLLAAHGGLAILTDLIGWNSSLLENLAAETGFRLEEALEAVLVEIQTEFSRLNFQGVGRSNDGADLTTKSVYRHSLRVWLGAVFQLATGVQFLLLLLEFHDIQMRRMVASYCAVMIVTAHGRQGAAAMYATGLVTIMLFLESSCIGWLWSNSHIEPLPLFFCQGLTVGQSTENIQIRGNTVAKYSIQSRKPGIQFVQS